MPPATLGSVSAIILLMIQCLFLLPLLAGPVPVSYSNSSLSDLDFLSAKLKGVQVVQLGEATHGGAEFYRLKTKLVRYLHEKLGYNILAIEAGMIETGLANHQRSKLTANEFLEATLFANYRWKETLPLFEYLKSQPDLKLIGIDPQFSSDELLTLSRDLIKPYDAILAAEAEKRLGEGYAFMGKTGQPDDFRRQRDSYLAWLKDFEARLGKYSPKPFDREDWATLRRGVAGLQMYWNYEPETPPLTRFELRDTLMYQNLRAQIGKDKAILWAHNGHIGKGLGYPIVGDHLRKSLGSKTYALGLFAQKGEFFQHWTNTVLPWQTAVDGLEAQLPKTGEAWFMETAGMTSAMKAFEPENGGLLTFVPAERFDGILTVSSLTAPAKR